MEKKKPGFISLGTDQLTFLVNGLAMQTHNELKPGHAEKFYQRRLADLCRANGLAVEMEKRVEVWVEDKKIGYLLLDLWIEETFVVECKAFSHALGADEFGQVMTYLTATGSSVGMLYNFGRKSLEFKRILPAQVVQDWQKYLYRVIHVERGQSLPSLPKPQGEGNLPLVPIPPIRFRAYVPEGQFVEIPSPSWAAVRASVRRAEEAAEIRNPLQKSAYADSGVSIDAGNRAVELMKSAVRATYTPAVLAGIGSFGGLLDASALKEMRHPVLVASTDGVGTKVKLAARLGRYRGIGQDIVNHCIDDILVQGARPLFFMDYFATAHLIPEHSAEIVTGIAEACQAADMVLLGGETAEMPGVYQPGEFDVAGTIVGVLERDQILPRSADLRAGDALIGIRSSGPHTNGFSLIRQVFADEDLETVFPEWGVSLADALLAPHRSYLKILQPVINNPHLKALAHLTGGGFIENIPRILPENLDARIRLGSWPLPALWQLIQQKGGIATDEMYRVFNMGIGMVAVVDQDFAADFQKLIPEETWQIGELVSGTRKTILS
ncbi:MAG: hypothetical protein OHK0031_01790 [Anaerolineales bacterium]